jgi:hypothetical protein
MATQLLQQTVNANKRRRCRLGVQREPRDFIAETIAIAVPEVLLVRNILC